MFAGCAAFTLGLDLSLLAGMEWNAFVTVGCCGGVWCLWGIIRFLRITRGPYEDFDREGDDTIEATNQYQLLTGPFLRCVVTFLAQTMLMAFYAQSLVQPLDLDERLKYWNFCAAIPIQLCAGSQFGRLDKVGFWTKVLRHRCAWTSKDPHGERLSADPSNYELFARCFLSLFANAIYIIMIHMGLPFILMNAKTPMDFVKDCVAIAYVTTLDDLTYPIEMRPDEPPSDAGQPQTRETPESSEIEDVEAALLRSVPRGDARP